MNVYCPASSRGQHESEVDQNLISSIQRSLKYVVSSLFERKGPNTECRTVEREHTEPRALATPQARTRSVLYSEQQVRTTSRQLVRVQQRHQLMDLVVDVMCNKCQQLVPFNEVNQHSVECQQDTRHCNYGFSGDEFEHQVREINE